MSEIELERRRRINASLWAYAYEIMDDPIVSDAKYDEVCLQINPKIKTGRLDDFFATEFDPSTGMWVYKHPEIDGIRAIYERLTKKASRPTPKEKPTTSSNLPSKTGFGTRLEMTIYLASLGFCTPPCMLATADRGVFYFEFDKKCFYITQKDYDCNILEQKTIFYKDLFKGNGGSEE